MPQVGNRHFSYDAKGRAAAGRYAASSGQKVWEGFDGKHDDTRTPGSDWSGPVAQRKTLPSQASDTARSRAFGQRGDEMRRANRPKDDEARIPEYKPGDQRRRRRTVLPGLKAKRGGRRGSYDPYGLGTPKPVATTTRR